MIHSSVRHLTILLTAVVLGTAAAMAQTPAAGSPAPDVSTDTSADSTAAALPTDLHAGFLIAEPGPAFYSAHGHCAVRLTCPSHGLDYCFTFCMDATLWHYIQYFRGTALAQYACIPTEAFLQDYVEENRTVVEHEINLTVDQVRALWRLFDEEAMRGPHYHFDFLRKNCSSMSLRAVERCLGDEHLVFGSLPPVVAGTYRQFIRRAAPDRPWTYFVWSTLVGRVGEEVGVTEDKVAPPVFVETLQQAAFVKADGSSRPVLTGNTTLMVEGGTIWTNRGLTPTSFFLLLTLLALVVTVLQVCRRGTALVKAFDVLLFAAQTVLGLFVFHQACLSNLDVMHYNWNLLVLNPLPVVLWACLHRRSWFRWVWLAFVGVLVLYMLLSFVTPQIGLYQVLMALPLLIRAAAHVWLAAPSR